MADIGVRKVLFAVVGQIYTLKLSTGILSSELVFLLL